MIRQGFCFLFVAVFSFFGCSLFALGGGEAAPSQAPAASGAAPAGGDAQAQQQTITADQAFAMAVANVERGDKSAMVTVGVFYEQGIGVERSFIKALEWYQKAADAGIPEGIYNLGVCYEVGVGNAGDSAKALSSFEKAASLGLVAAMEKLSSIYTTGTLGVARNDGRALTYMVQASDGGSVSAANSLGIVYLQGLMGQAVDNQRAYGYFIKAAEAGHVEAIKNLGILYRDGLGINKDPVQALKWFIIAWQGGYQSPDMDGAIKELRSGLGNAQAQSAEDQANQWVAAFKARTGAQ